MAVKCLNCDSLLDEITRGQGCFGLHWYCHKCGSHIYKKKTHIVGPVNYRRKAKSRCYTKKQWENQFNPEYKEFKQ